MVTPTLNPSFRGGRPERLSPRQAETLEFYRRSLLALNGASVQYLVGGAFALSRYTGIGRRTKDLDLFVRQKDLDLLLRVLADAGFRTEVTFPHWLGKAFSGRDLVDVIHSSGNGIVAVDDEWLEHAVGDDVLGVPVKLCPVEEMLWSKAFIMERERFDGSDVLHLLRARADMLDWKRLVRRFGAHWRVLFGHLVLFGYVYPSDRDMIPRWVLQEMTWKLVGEQEAPPPEAQVCRGTLLSRAQFLVDVEQWGYEDARLDPDIPMTTEHIAQWTRAIGEEARTYDDTQRDHPAGRSR